MSPCRLPRKLRHRVSEAGLRLAAAFDRLHREDARCVHCRRTLPRSAFRTNRLRGVSFRYRAMLRVIERSDARRGRRFNPAYRRHQTRAPCSGTQLGIDAISEELYRHVKFLLTQYRLDRTNDTEPPADRDPFPDLERPLTRQAAGRDHLLAAAQLIAIRKARHRRPPYGPAQTASTLPGYGTQRRRRRTRRLPRRRNG